MTKEKNQSPHLTGFQRHLPRGVKIVSALYSSARHGKDGRTVLSLEIEDPAAAQRMVEDWRARFAPLQVVFHADDAVIAISPYPNELWKVLDGNHWIEISHDARSIRISPTTASDEGRRIIPCFM